MALRNNCPPTRFSATGWSAVCGGFALLLLLGGCAPSPAPEEKIDPAAWASPHAVSVSHSSTVSAAEGPVPLVYEVGAPGIVRVVDETTGKQIGGGEVHAGQFVSVNAYKGVVIGGVAGSGPVPADHRYMITLEISHPEAGPNGAAVDKK